MKILFYDTECNDLDKEFGVVQELAWAVFDIQTKRLIHAKSFLLKHERHYDVAPSAFEATGLTQAFSEKNGYSAGHVFGDFISDVEHVQLIGGHNITEFDDEILSRNIKRTLFGWPEHFLSLPRVDTMLDCPYPSSIKIKQLKFLALEHGYVMSSAHEALADVLACAHIFFSYPFEKCREIYETPIVNLFAYTDYHDQRARDLCYQEKFRWDREGRRFQKRTRKFFLEGLRARLEHVHVFVDGEPEAQEESDQLSMEIAEAIVQEQKEVDRENDSKLPV